MWRGCCAAIEYPMSEKKSEPRDRTPVYIAIVGATATVLAALITQLPNLMNRPEVTPTPIVITATPPPTHVTQATNMSPGATTAPSTTAPTATVELRAASATPVPSSPTPDNIVTLVLVNNLPQAMEFFVDGVSVSSIDSGAYQVVPVERGRHEFKQCVHGSDTANPNNCFAKSTILNDAVDYWEMFETNSSIPPQSTLKLIVINQSSTPQDIFMDGIFAKTVNARDFIELNGPGGLHTIQPCAQGATPASGSCGERTSLQLSKRIEIYKILGNVP